MTNLSIKLYGFITGLLHREEGQDLVEYAVLVGFIAVVAAVSLPFILNATTWDAFAQKIKDCVNFSAAC